MSLQKRKEDGLVCKIVFCRDLLCSKDKMHDQPIILQVLTQLKNNLGVLFLPLFYLPIHL